MNLSQTALQVQLVDIDNTPYPLPIAKTTRIPLKCNVVNYHRASLTILSAMFDTRDRYLEVKLAAEIACESYTCRTLAMHMFWYCRGKLAHQRPKLTHSICDVRKKLCKP